MENEISILIVEDEQIWIKNLQLLLEDFGYSVAGVASNIEDALTALSTCDYDLILLDIHLNGRNSGIELGKVINKLYNKPFIFITAGQANDIREATFVNPSAYLIKPVNGVSLFVAIQNAINNFDKKKEAVPATAADEPTSFFVKVGNRYKKIYWKDVVSISAGKNYVDVYNAPDNSHYYIRSSLQKTLQYIIPEHLQKQFIQVNRADVVQLSYIQEVVNDEVKTAYKNLPLSDTFARDVKLRLNIIS